MTTFDPYHVWLGIPPGEQPPTHYRLLALAPYEESPEVIENAADRQMAHVRRAASGKHADRSQQILNEISAASRCLLKAESKREYDNTLRAKEKPIAKAQPIPVTASPPGIAATMEWTAPPKPPKAAAPKRPSPRRNAAPPKPSAESPENDANRWKGAPHELSDSPAVVVTDSPVRVAGGSNVSQRVRSKQSNAWVLLSVIGVLATLPILALLIALATMDRDTSVAQEDVAAATTNVTASSHGESSRPAVNLLPLPGVEDATDDQEEEITSRPDRPRRNRPLFPPNDSDGNERDPFDDTPSFGEVELGSDSSTGGESVDQTVTVPAKRAMIQLALFRLPSATGTGITLAAGQTVKLHIDGQFRIGGQAHDLRGPEGLWIAVGQREGPATQHFKGAADVEFVVQKPGELFLAVDDLLPFDNQGELTVDVVVEN